MYFQICRETSFRWSVTYDSIQTRLLVTHAVTFLPRVDEVIVIKDGQMLEKGTYTNLVAKQGDFASYVLRHQNENAEDKSEKGRRVTEKVQWKKL